MKATGEKFNYEVITDYILHRNPSSGDIMKEFNITRSYITGSINNIEDETMKNYLYAIIKKNSYRDLKGYQMYKYLIFNPKADFKQLNQLFKIRDKFNFKRRMTDLVKSNPTLESEVETLIKRFC